MPRVPPVVRSADAGGLAYLLAWERLPGEAWGAHIAWVILDDGAWKVRSNHVPADDLEQVDGQDYSAVPVRRGPPPVESR